MDFSREIKTPDEILNTTHYVVKKISKDYERDGIPLEKGAIITSKKIDMKWDLFTKYCWFWSVYPDAYISLITPRDSKFKLKFF